MSDPKPCPFRLDQDLKPDQKTIPVAVNPSYGGFGFTGDVLKLINAYRVEEGLPPFDQYASHNYDFYHPETRTCRHLIRAIQELGEEVACLHLDSVSVAAYRNGLWKISEYDGMEGVEEDTKAIVLLEDRDRQIAELKVEIARLKA